MQLSLIAAVARNGVIGRDGDLPWRLPDDLAHFKRLTSGHAVVMGRRTWESIGRPLPKRTNLVVSRTLTPPEGVRVAPSLDAALAAARESGASRAFVIGGAALYAESLPLVDVLELTRVEAEVEGDVHFPAWDPSAFDCTCFEAHPADARHAHPFRFETWQRTPSQGSSQSLPL